MCERDVLSLPQIEDHEPEIDRIEKLRVFAEVFREERLASASLRSGLRTLRTLGVASRSFHTILTQYQILAGSVGYWQYSV